MVSFQLLESTATPPQKVADLLDAWRRFNTDGKGPTRSDFTPFVLKPWLGNIDIYDVETAGTDLDFRMRLNGTEIVAMTGEDWTGSTARDIDRRFGVHLHDELLAVYRSQQPLTDRIRIFQKNYITAHRVLLPIFSERHEGEVAQIFLAIFDEN